MEMIMMDLQIDRAGNWKKIDRMTAQERGRQREREREIQGGEINSWQTVEHSMCCVSGIKNDMLMHPGFSFRCSSLLLPSSAFPLYVSYYASKN